MKEIKVVQIPRINPQEVDIQFTPKVNININTLGPSAEEIINRFLSGEITAEEYQKLLSEVIIRFNTEPRKYEKADYRKLIQAIIGAKKILEQKLKECEERLTDKIEQLIAQLEEFKNTIENYFASINSDLQEEIQNRITADTALDNKKQDKLIAGDGIKIENNIISNTRVSAEWGNITGSIEDQVDLQSALSQKVDKVTGSSLMTSDEHSKLEGIESGAQVNVQSDWNSLDGDSFIKNKPTKLSDFTDDLGDSPIHTHNQYLTEHQDISGKQDVLTAGTGINITNNVISATVDTSDKMNKDGSNYIAGLTLVSPSISCTWDVKNSTGDTLYTYSNTSINVERGAKVAFIGTWKYPSAEEGYKNPTSCSGSWGVSLPNPNNNSSKYTDSLITSNTSYIQTIYAPKSGLEVFGNKVIKASGNDETSATVSVSFYHRRFWGVSTSNSEDITTLSTELSNSKSKNITYDCSGNKYFYYAYPKSLGNTSWKVGGLAFSGYTRTEQTITNEYGLSVTYYVYRSTTAQTGSDIKAEIS